jgi:hypothetical protein
MSTPVSIIAYDRYILLLQSDSTLWYSFNNLPLVWTNLSFGGTGTPKSMAVIAIQPAGQSIPVTVTMYLCVVSSDGTLWALNIGTGTWTKVTNLPP